MIKGAPSSINHNLLTLPQKRTTPPISSMVVICAEWRRIEKRYKRKGKKNKYSRIQKSRKKKRGKTYFPIRSHDNSILEAFENGEWGYVWGRREKKYSWSEKEIVAIKKGHVHQTSGARCVRTDNIVKNGIVIEVKVS